VNKAMDLAYAAADNNHFAGAGTISGWLWLESSSAVCYPSPHVEDPQSKKCTGNSVRPLMIREQGYRTIPDNLKQLISDDKLQKNFRIISQTSQTNATRTL
jgi:hypothetical protein